MPLTTRCRHCGRLFPVYAQQLKKRRAAVECPRCNRTTNALHGLVDEALPASRGGAVTRDRHPVAKRLGVTSATSPPMSVPQPAPAPRRGGGLWFLGSLLLLGVLAGQAVGWGTRLGPWGVEAQTLAARACESLPCTLDYPRIEGAVQLLRPRLLLHPEQPGALRLELALANQGALPQRAPVIELALAGRGAQLRRRFMPEDLLPGKRLIGPGDEVDVMLEIAPPGFVPSGFEVEMR